MRYEILGSLRVVHGGRESALRAHKAEVLLAVLLVRANQIVPSDTLVRELWADSPPRRASDGLYVYICQLRKFLSGVSGGHRQIQTRSPGYSLRLEDGELDLHAFQAAVLDGRRRLDRQDWDAAVAVFDRALDLWRDAPFGGLPGGPILSGFALWLEEARLECLELRMTALIMSGRHREAVNELFSLTAAHPVHEAFYQLLMLALYRSNRQADAVRVYRRARSLIVDEIGLEPGRAMRDLHQAILVADSSLDTMAAI